MGNNMNKLFYLIDSNQESSFWDLTDKSILPLNDANLQNYEEELQQLTSDINTLHERIEQEIALTEKITSSIKSRTNDPKKDLSAMKDIEIQWRTAQANIDSIKKMMQPKIEKKERLLEKIKLEQKLAIDNAIESIQNNLSTEITNIETTLNSITLSIRNIFTLHKSLMEIHKKYGKFNGIEDIVPNPVDSFDVFYNSIGNYLEALKPFLSLNK
jgi:chromosome segregation ATPase